MKTKTKKKRLKTTTSLFKFRTGYTFPHNIIPDIKAFFRMFKLIYQRARYGVSDKDTWDYDQALNYYIANGLTRYKELANGSPIGMDFDDYQVEIQKLIDQFNELIEINEDDSFPSKLTLSYDEYRTKYIAAYTNLARITRELWW